MKMIRIIPRLDVKGPNVVKGIHLEGLRIVGKPNDLAKRYYDQGADEILYIDIVASLYERNNLTDVVEKATSSGVYIPITVGGGIRSIEDVKKLLRSGADKVAINTAATRNPSMITEAARMFGSQCIVGSIEAKYKEGRWEAYIDNGRERTGLDAVEWAKKLVELGAGELLVTSVDRDGTQKGFDTELVKKIVEEVPVPVIACGGAGNEEDIASCAKETGCDGIAFGSILHYGKTDIQKVKRTLNQKGVVTREQYRNDLTPKVKRKTVSILDYGAGNLKSVINAFRAIGSDVKVIYTKEEIIDSELLVIPGDGAFGYAMQQLNADGLGDAIKDYVGSGRPLLGICLGMQILMTESEEFGKHQGLGIIDGKVVKFDEKSDVEDPAYVVPHMGWNRLMKAREWKGTMLSDVNGEPLAYFVHSYKVMPEDRADIVAETEYGGQRFCTVLQRGNVYGTQFHPEKSGDAGMMMIEYFSNL